MTSKVFRYAVTVASIPLVFFIFHFSGDPRWSWLSKLSELVLIAGGLVGGILGFWKYGIKREPLPSSASSHWLKPTAKWMLLNRTSRSNYRPFVAIMLFLLSAVAISFFCFNIFVVAGGGEKMVSATAPISVTKPGHYTLFVRTSQPAITNRFEMVAKDSKETIEAETIYGTEELRRDGEKYRAVCHFNILSTGTYFITCGRNQMNYDMIFMRQLALGFIAKIFVTFIVSLLSFVLGVRYCIGGMRAA